MTELYRKEFTEDMWPYDDEVRAIMAAGFEDCSWHNDVCVSFFRETKGMFDLRLWVDAVNPGNREDPEAPRFHISLYTKNFEDAGDDYLYFGEVLDEALRAARVYSSFSFGSTVE